jgi:predicted nucleic acid-binding protein
LQPSGSYEPESRWQTKPFNCSTVIGTAKQNFWFRDLFFAEFANILWKAQLRGRCGAAFAESAIREVVSMGSTSLSSFSLIEAAIQIARGYQRTVYDCIYVAMAMEPGCAMITADERLAALLGGLPVLWLGLL